MKRILSTGGMSGLNIGESLLCLLFLVISGCGATHKLYERATPSQETFVATEIPLAFDHGYPYVTVWIDSVGCEFFLDTGAASVTLALLPETVESLELAKRGGIHSLQTNYGRTYYRKSIIPLLKLGDLTFSNVLCDQQDTGIPVPGKPRGIMGLALLKPFNVLIDYQTSKLIIYNNKALPAGFDLSEWNSIPLIDMREGLHISGSLDGGENQLKFCLDTGAVAARENYTIFYNLLKPAHFDTLSGVDTFAGVQVIESADFSAGSAKLTGMHFMAFDFMQPESIDGFLGAGFFQKNRVFINFKNNTVYVQEQMPQ